NPLVVPETVLAQRGNRVQHALRAYRPREQLAVKTAAGTFRPDADLNTYDMITHRGTGEARASALAEQGIPSVALRTPSRPPARGMGTITADERAKIMSVSPVAGLYDEVVDRESAYEILQKRAADAATAREEADKAAQQAEASNTSGWKLP